MTISLSAHCPPLLWLLCHCLMLLLTRLFKSHLVFLLGGGLFALLITIWQIIQAVHSCLSLAHSLDIISQNIALCTCLPACCYEMMAIVREREREREREQQMGSKWAYSENRWTRKFHCVCARESCRARKGQVHHRRDANCHRSGGKRRQMEQKVVWLCGTR